MMKILKTRTNGKRIKCEVKSDPGLWNETKATDDLLQLEIDSLNDKFMVTNDRFMKQFESMARAI